MIPVVGRGNYKQVWDFTKDEKQKLIAKLTAELPALRGKVGASQSKIAEAIGVSRQTYSAYETQAREIPWTIFLALLFYFNSMPSTHYLLRQMEIYPKSLDDCWEQWNAAQKAEQI